jgi:hypothetical protein
MGPETTELGGITGPGVERVDINADGSGCHVVWINNSERIPTVVSKLSLASGLIYSYSKDDTSPLDPWYFTALDVRTGRLVFKQLAGTGFAYNNNYAPVTLGPDGAAYVGAIGGLVEIRDAIPPNAPPPLPPSGSSSPSSAAPLRVGLHLRRLSHRRLRVTATATAPIARVRYVLVVRGHTRARHTRRAPHLAATFSLRGLHVRVVIHATVRLRSGRLVSVRRSLRAG